MSRPFLTLLFSKTLLFCLLYCWKNRCYVYLMRYWGCRTKLWTEIDDTKNFVEWMRLSLFTHTLKCIRENGQLRFGKFKIFVDSIINFNARKTFFELQTFIELNPKKLCLKNPLFCLSSFLDKMLTSRIVCSVINTLEAK